MREAQQDTHGSNFRCPVCRKPHDLPANSEVTLEWVQTFPLNTVIIKMIEAAESTAESTREDVKEERRTCHPCQAEGEINAGVKFCFECKEILCKDCTKCHRRFKMTKDHKLADIESIPTKHIDIDTLDIVSKCTTHEEQELDVYCKTHAVFICMYCMAADHKACNVVPSSSPDIDMSTLREESEKLNAQINALLKHIDLLQKLREENKNDLKQKLKEINESAEQARDQVVQLMDNVVKHVTEVTKQVEYETEHTLDEGMARIGKIKHHTEQKLTLLDTIRKLGSDRHRYVSSKRIKEQCIEIESQITEEDKRLKVVDVELKLTDDIRKILEYTEVEKLIELTMKDHDSDHRHYGAEPNSAGEADAGVNTTIDSMMVKVDEPNPTGEVDAGVNSTRDVKLVNVNEPNLRDLDIEVNSTRDSKLVKVDEPNATGDLDTEVNSTRDSKLVKVDEHTVRPNDKCEPLFTGVSMLRDGRIALCDYCWRSPECGYLCVYNPADKTTLKLKMNRPHSVTCIDDKHLAVCCPLDKTISILSVGGELRVEKTLKTKTLPCSIAAFKDDQFAMSWGNPPAFSLVDISGTEISQTMYIEQDKRGRKFKYFDYLALDRRRQHVIQPCYIDKAVYCFDITGEPVFTYSHPELVDPRGVALDKCGNIYVCDHSHPGSIHKLSPAGEAISIFRDGIPSFPGSICNDSTGTRFWVTQYTDNHCEKVVHFKLEV